MDGLRLLVIVILLSVDCNGKAEKNKHRTDQTKTVVRHQEQERELDDEQAALAQMMSDFTDPLKAKMAELESKVETLSRDDRKNVFGFLEVAEKNFRKLGNTESDSAGAIVAAVKIAGATSEFFGPAGQMNSIVGGFISALLGLFGNGPKSKKIGDVVKEQIDAALSKYPDKTLKQMKVGTAKLFEDVKSILDGYKGEAVTNDTLQQALSSKMEDICKQPSFLTKLGELIVKMLSESGRDGDEKKCIEYCELYARLAGLQDMLLTQFISLITQTSQKIIDIQNDFRDKTKKLLEPLYTADVRSVILPYFDPDNSIVTDAYATSLLNLGKYDRSMTGMYCLKASGKDFRWATAACHAFCFIRGRIRYPYTNLASSYVSSNDNCYWKLVPHGENIFSIVNKKGCGSKKSDSHYCDWLLTWATVKRWEKGSVPSAIIHPFLPTLWEIKGGSGWFRIRNKFGCGTGGKYCDKDLRVQRTTKSVGGHFMRNHKPMLISEAIGRLVDGDGKNHWQLRKLK